MHTHYSFFVPPSVSFTFFSLFYFSPCPCRFSAAEAMCSRSLVRSWFAFSLIAFSTRFAGSRLPRGPALAALEPAAWGVRRVVVGVDEDPPRPTTLTDPAFTTAEGSGSWPPPPQPCLSPPPLPRPPPTSQQPSRRVSSPHVARKNSTNSRWRDECRDFSFSATSPDSACCSSAAARCCDATGDGYGRSQYTGGGRLWRDPRGNPAGCGQGAGGGPAIMRRMASRSRNWMSSCIAGSLSSSSSRRVPDKSHALATGTREGAESP